MEARQVLESLVRRLLSRMGLVMMRRATLAHLKDRAADLQARLDLLASTCSGSQAGYAARTAAEIERAKAAVMAKYGRWTAENIDLGHGVVTGGFSTQGVWDRLHGSTQIMYDLLHRQDLSGVRILDLGALEGLFSIEFARHGATVVAVEGRTANIRKAEFAAEMLGLRNLSFVQCDAVHVSLKNLGSFDFVHCAGLLYHLNVDRALMLIRNIAEMATRGCIIETCYATEPKEKYVFGDHEYFGASYREFAQGITPAEKEACNWSALQEDCVFFFTEPSLINAMIDAGCTSVYTVLHPHVRPNANRRAFVGLRHVEAAVKTGDEQFKRFAPSRVPEREALEYARPTHLSVRNPRTRKALPVAPLRS
jgi:2-polyprenyl-3-methyl-5-hydroxy-6-metoxy-1,4-benzoquinol methylase